MKHFLVATDFSTRSDRALRRAVLLARVAGARLTLLHVVDDDQPRRIVDTEHEAAQVLLDDYAATLSRDDGIDCTARVVLADPFVGIAAATADASIDLLVLGPHRRQVLRDVFVGTTAERALKAAHCPVIMANAAPAAPYDHVLYATDLSTGATHALATAEALGIAGHARRTLLHVFDAPGLRLLMSQPLPAEDKERIVVEATDTAGRRLAEYARAAGYAAFEQAVRLERAAAADVVLNTAAERAADLIVVGSRGLGDVARFMLGSVAGEILRRADRDVLVVPPAITRTD